jgi:hypothetical protein
MKLPFSFGSMKCTFSGERKKKRRCVGREGFSLGELSIVSPRLGLARAAIEGRSTTHLAPVFAQVKLSKSRRCSSCSSCISCPSQNALSSWAASRPVRDLPPLAVDMHDEALKSLDCSAAAGFGPGPPLGGRGGRGESEVGGVLYLQKL